jgi:hypothetical protein
MMIDCFNLLDAALLLNALVLLSLVIAIPSFVLNAFLH